jgi:hypothetical protein
MSPLLHKFSNWLILFKDAFLFENLSLQMAYGFIFGDLENFIYLNPWHLGNSFVLLNHGLFTGEETSSPSASMLAF